MKIHHKQSHGDSLVAINEVECDGCGEVFSREERRLGENNYCSPGCNLSVEGKEHPMGGVTGQDHPQSGTTLPEDHPFRHQKGKDNPRYGVECPEHVKKSVSEATTGQTPAEGSGWCSWYSVPELDKKVQGRLELKIVRSLLDVFDINRVDVQVQGDFNYTVDFVVDNVVIEAKGRVREKCIEKGEKFLQEFGDKWTYIVIGQIEETKKIPSHKHFYDDEIDEAILYISEVNHV
jgi:hypothetical protein